MIRVVRQAHECQSAASSQGYLSVDAALNPHDGAGIVAKFRMLRLEQILADYRKFELACVACQESAHRAVL